MILAMPLLTVSLPTFLPRFDWTRNDHKQRVGLDGASARETPQALRVTLSQLGLQMVPLKGQLVLGNGQSQRASLQDDLGGVEGIASLGRLVVDGPQVSRDGSQRLGGLPEPVQL